MTEYLDFDLLIQPAGDKYRAHVLKSPAGEATVTFELPFSELEVENFLLRIGQRRRGARRVDSPELEAAKAFGGRLFDAVFSDEVHSCLRASLNEVNHRGNGLRIRLRLKDVPNLADLPWEYLYNSSVNRFLALSIETPLVRYLDLPEPIIPLHVSPPLRVLVAIASPNDYPQLDVEGEWASLRKALGDLEQRRLIALERLDEATLAGLQGRFRRAKYHIFHFIGHGGFDQATQDGVLVMEDEQGRGRLVSGQDLGMLLHDHRTLRLAILNACEGARVSRHDPFSGVAQSLVQQGIPSVIAMQFEITDQAAKTFAREFYGAVADGYLLDAALAEARKAIFAEGNSFEWGTPVLYLRAPDGRIFDVEAEPSEPPTPIAKYGGVSPQQTDRESHYPETGTMYPDSACYVVRKSDLLALNEIAKRGEGGTITIKGPRQVGKSSLLVRMIDAAGGVGKCVAYLDFQLMERAALTNADIFFRQFCAWLTDVLQIEDRVDEHWNKNKFLGNTHRCSRYVSRYLLKTLSKTLVIAMDEVDIIFDTPFRSDFFGMLRAWHNSRGNPNDQSWKALDLVLVTSTEPYYFIDNLTQSPFNVGLEVTLEDFTPEQVAELNGRYNSPLSRNDEHKLITLLGGHPYLVHRAIRLVLDGRISTDELVANGTSDPGPFGDHLRNLLFRLRDKEELIESLRQVIQRNVCPDDKIFFRLQGAGLVRREGKAVVPRCNLYAGYFREHLNV